MAPRTRSGRRFTSTLAPSDDSSVAFSTGNSAVLHLPDEIYLEIASHIPATPVPTDSSSDANFLTDCAARHATLAALTHTCRTLRRIFLRYLWERIEVLEGMPTENGYLPILDLRAATASMNSNARIRYKVGSKRYATELIRQLEIVTVREPQLAQFVRIVNVVITDYSESSVLSEFARALSRFPNLHTLQIGAYPRERYRRNLREFGVAFSGKYSLPQIQNLYLSPGFPVEFLLLCPNVRHASWRSMNTPGPRNALRYFQGRWDTDKLPKLAIFETALLDYCVAEDLSKIAPNICQVVFDLRQFKCRDLESRVFPYCENLWPFSRLKQLHTFTVKVNSERTSQHWTDLGRQIFERQSKGASSRSNPRRIVVIYGEDGREEYVMGSTAKES